MFREKEQPNDQSSIVVQELIGYMGSGEENTQFFENEY